MKTKIETHIILTSSKILAFLITLLGFTLSFYLKECSVAIASVAAAGVIIAVKTGSTAYFQSKKE